jgi:hypothetical protein
MTEKSVPVMVASDKGFLMSPDNLTLFPRLPISWETCGCFPKFIHEIMKLQA